MKATYTGDRLSLVIRKTGTRLAPDRPTEVTGEEAELLAGRDDVALDEGDTPNQSDSKATWVDFAVSQGTDREEAEAMTKAELTERFD